jgi:hypothetical protein
MAWHGWRRFRPQKTEQTAVDNAESVDAAVLLRSLLEKTPGAVRAQRSMDDHPNAYHATNQARLFELIDFNDTFVNLALALNHEERKGFIERLRVSMQSYCKKMNEPMFTDDQFDAITRGLSREVAVYLGAKRQGFGVRMTSRREDAMGVDMVIFDPKTGKSLNIDCKTSSAYHFRVKDLVHQGRMTKDEGLRAEERGYAHEVNGHKQGAVAVTLLRIDPNELGDIADFEFKEPKKLGSKLRIIMSEV